MTDNDKIEFNISLNEFFATCHELGIPASVVESNEGGLVIEVIMIECIEEERE